MHDRFKQLLRKVSVVTMAISRLLHRITRAFSVEPAWLLYSECGARPVLKGPRITFPSVARDRLSVSQSQVILYRQVCSLGMGHVRCLGKRCTPAL